MIADKNQIVSSSWQIIQINLLFLWFINNTKYGWESHFLDKCFLVEGRNWHQKRMLSWWLIFMVWACKAAKPVEFPDIICYALTLIIDIFIFICYRDWFRCNFKIVARDWDMSLTNFIEKFCILLFPGFWLLSKIFPSRKRILNKYYTQKFRSNFRVFRNLNKTHYSVAE